jgi:uncharacterized RDD family membrane protein YckC
MRLLALLIDAALLLPILFGLVYYLQDVQTAPVSVTDFIFVSGLFIYSWTELFFGGTPGKLLLGLRIAGADGSPAEFWKRFSRWLTKQLSIICWLLFILTQFQGFYVVGGFMNLVLGIGFLYSSNDDKQAWHDQWCGTAVYRKKRRGEAAGFPVTVVDPPRSTVQDDVAAES